MSRLIGVLVLVSVLCWCGVESVPDLPSDYKSFLDFVLKYAKPYLNDPTEMAKRFGIYQNNIKMMNTLNNPTSLVGDDDSSEDSNEDSSEDPTTDPTEDSNEDSNEDSTEESTTTTDEDSDEDYDDDVTYGPNEFSDMTWDEFRGSYANLNGTEHELVAQMEEWDDRTLSKKKKKKGTPQRFDWRRKKRVSPIKNQGSCGSCWAFSVCANCENVYMIKNKGKQVLFSEQQLLDCDQTSHGCQGGWPNTAIEDTIRRGGLMDSQSYPYQGQQGGCRFNKAKVKAKISKNVKLPGQNEPKIAEYISKFSSVIILINANNDFQHYRSGIYNPSVSQCDNSQNSYNHALIMVAYGKPGKKGMNFWVLKNSWGTGWGENGYMRIRRGTNACGLANYVNSAVLA